MLERSDTVALSLHPYLEPFVFIITVRGVYSPPVRDKDLFLGFLQSVCHVLHVIPPVHIPGQVRATNHKTAYVYVLLHNNNNNYNNNNNFNNYSMPSCVFVFKKTLSENSYKLICSLMFLLQCLNKQSNWDKEPKWNGGREIVKEREKATKQSTSCLKKISTQLWY